MLAESQPPRLGVSGPGRIGRLSQVSGLERGERAGTRHHHEPDRLGDVGGRQSRGCLALGGREVAQADIYANEDQRDGGVPFVGELRPVLRSPGGQGLLHGRFQLAGHPVAERLKRREPGGQPRIGRNLPGVLKQVKVLTAASRIPRQQQVGGQAQQAFRRLCQYRRVGHVEDQRLGHRRGVQEVRHDPVLEERQGPVSLLRGQIMVGGTPGVSGSLEPFCRPQLKHLLASAVPGAQLGAQYPAHQTVVPEAGPLVVERHQEQVSGVDSAQQRRRVLPSGDRGACVRGHRPRQDGGVEHELGQLRRLLLEDLGDEVVGDGLAADLQRPRQPRRIRGSAQGQRRHLQDRGPTLASLMEQRQVSIG